MATPELTKSIDSSESYDNASKVNFPNANELLGIEGPGNSREEEEVVKSGDLFKSKLFLLRKAFGDEIPDDLTNKVVNIDYNGINISLSNGHLNISSDGDRYALTSFLDINMSFFTTKSSESGGYVTHKFSESDIENFSNCIYDIISNVKKCKVSVSEVEVGNVGEAKHMKDLFDSFPFITDFDSQQEINDIKSGKLYRSLSGFLRSKFSSIPYDLSDVDVKLMYKLDNGSFIWLTLNDKSISVRLPGKTSSNSAEYLEIKNIGDSWYSLGYIVDNVGVSGQNVSFKQSQFKSHRFKYIVNNIMSNADKCKVSVKKLENTGVKTEK